MGCDIHCYVEHTSHRRHLDGKLRWQSFGGKINPGRHYGIFAKLAGVRNCYESGIVPISEPRGAPDDLGRYANDDNTLYICDYGGENHCTAKQAQQWVASGYSNYTDDSRRRVTHPDWHSHSWVTPDEFGEALADPKLSNIDVEYFALLAAMRELEKRGHETRLVFWFDN